MTGERTLPGLGLTGYWDEGSPYKDDMDVNLRLLSAVVQANALSVTTTPPGTGTAGDVYIVPSDDLTNPNKVAIWDGASGSEDWVYLDPDEGWFFYVEDESTHYRFTTSGGWEEFAAGGGGGEVDLDNLLTEAILTEDVGSEDLTAYGANEVIIPVGGADEIDIAAIGLSDTGGGPESRMQVSTDGGSTWLSGTEYIKMALNEGYGGSGVYGYIEFTSTTSGDPSSTKATIRGLQRTTPKMVDVLQVQGDAWNFGAMINTPDPVTHIRIYTNDADNFDAGEIIWTTRTYARVAYGAGGKQKVGFAQYTPPTGVWTLVTEATPDGLSDSEYVPGEYVLAINDADEQWYYGTEFDGNAGVFDVVGVVDTEMPNDDFATAGFYIGNGTKQLQIGPLYDGQVIVKKHDAHVLDSQIFYSSAGSSFRGRRLWYRAVGDGTNVELWLSEEGLNWTLIHQEALATFIGTPTEAGLFSDAGGVTAGSVIKARLVGIDFDGPQVEMTIRDAFVTDRDTETGTAYELVSADLMGNKIKFMDDASPITVTINAGLSGREPVTFVQQGAGSITFSAGAGVTLNSLNGNVATAGQYATVSVIPMGDDTFLLAGALA